MSRPQPGQKKRMNTTTGAENTSAPEVPQPKTKGTPAKKTKPAKNAAG
jgi:hypothetical protein